MPDGRLDIGNPLLDFSFLTKTEVRGEFLAFLKKPVLVVEDAKLSLSRLFSVVVEDYRGGRLHLGYGTEPDAVSRADCERQIRPRCSLASRRFSDSVACRRPLVH